TAGADAESVRRAVHFLDQVAPGSAKAFQVAHFCLDLLARGVAGRRIKDLPPDRLDALIASFAETRLTASLLHAVSSVYKIAHFDRTDIHGALRTPVEMIAAGPPERWEQNARHAYDVSEDIECDVVVVGT